MFSNYFHDRKIYKDIPNDDQLLFYEMYYNEILKVLDLIENKKAVYVPQNDNEATYAKKIDKFETKIDWNDKAENVIAKINAFSPKPGAWFFMQNERIKILKAEEVEQKGNIAEVMNVNFTIGCAENSVKILRLQKEGKKEMDVSEFLLGTKLKKGTKIN